MRKTIISAIFLTLTAFAANAADICKAIAVRDVASVENPSSILPRGSYDTAITQYNVRKSDGFPTFCSHGGYCYPANSLKLINCRIGAKSYSDSETDTYSVDVVRSKVSSRTLRYDDLDNRLLEMGLCSACASNAANIYLTKPNSRCAQAVRAALEGNPMAARNLSENFDRLCPY